MLKTFQAAWDETSRSLEALKATMDKLIPPQARPGRAAQLIDSRFVTAVTSGRAPVTRVGCGDSGCSAGVGGWDVGFEFTPAGIVWTGFSWKAF